MSNASISVVLLNNDGRQQITTLLKRLGILPEKLTAKVILHCVNGQIGGVELGNIKIG
jgi:hypothetical protein